LESRKRGDFRLMQTARDTSDASSQDANAARTARFAVLAGTPGLLLTAYAAASSTSLTIRADLVLTFLDMLVLAAAWVLASRTERVMTNVPKGKPALAEALVTGLAALCMSLSMTVVAGIAVQRIAAGGVAVQGSGVILGMALNFAYGGINFWILRRWRARNRLAPSPLVRSQICLFSDKLSSNLLIAVSLAAALILEGTAVARFIDPIAGLLIATATARWTIPVVRDTARGLRSEFRSGRKRALSIEG
jgi:Co/Zn/Cd efflux system component